MSLIRYEVVDRTGVITLDRADKANAQTPPMLDELDDAWMRAAKDDAVRVIVLRAEGKHFSAGHDITASRDAALDREGGAAATPTAGGNGSGSLRGDPSFPDWNEGGLASIWEWESERYLGYTRKWRDVRKPSIAAVQGQCIAGGLMLCWPCDLIIASEDARFSDPVVRMGIGGVEYHGHTWEFGARKAKELLFTGQAIDAAEAHRLGMVNRVVTRDRLDAEVMELAAQIGQMDPFGLAQAKRAVNQTIDVMGFYTALQSVFDIHQTGHGNALSRVGYPIMVDLDAMKAAQDKR